MREALKALLLLCVAAALLAQSGLSHTQLRQFIKSSVDQKLRDKDVAAYLKGQSARFRISDRLIEEFVGWGIGQRTLNALEAMQAASAAMPEPSPEPPPAKAAPPQPPPPSEQEQERIIEQARSFANDYTRDLPNYVCLQVTRRYIDPTGLAADWLRHDEIKTRLAYIEGRENYETVSVNDRATTRSFAELGGTTSTGEFGTILDHLFAPSTAAKFRWARHSLLRGRPTWVFFVDVPQQRSRWTLTSDGATGASGRKTVVAGYSGQVHIGKESGHVLRIVMEAEDLPVSFPMQEARSRLDFDFIDLSGEKFLLPLKAQAYIRTGRLLTKNDLEFRLYRKFSAETTITFEEIEGIEPLPEDEPVE